MIAGLQLDDAVRHSWPARISAVSFIVIVLAGNIWLARGMVGASIPQWLGVVFALGLGGASIGGIGLLYVMIRRRLAPPVEQDHDYQ